MYKEYLSMALTDMVVARWALCEFTVSKHKGFKEIAAFHVEQAMELILKYSIYNNTKYNEGCGESDVKQITTLSIDKLISEYCIPYGIYVPKKIQKNASKYSGWEDESRYALDFSVRVDAIESALSTTEEWLISIKPAYRVQLNKYKSR